MLISGMVLGAGLILVVNRMVIKTSTNEYCQSCHIHTVADNTWPQSVHYQNQSGVRTGCVECHLPPHGDFKHFSTKVKTGIHDFLAYHFKDSASFDWESKRQLEHAVNFVYNESCIRCHENLYPKGITEDGGTAHLYYDQHAEKLDLQCINCHLNAGHYLPNYKHGEMTGVIIAHDEDREFFTEATNLTSFTDFTEQIPNTSISFSMLAIEGGSFQMGSPEDEPLRRDDEGPVRNVEISPFFMGEVEVSWDEFWTFYSQTMSEGRTNPDWSKKHNASMPDAISGPTPPFGNPDQGWGSGNRPAITMSHYAAQIYCQWLSMEIGKNYRLPTEAEWEYACRGGSSTAYFFEGDPKRFASEGLRNRIFGVDTTRINSHAVYIQNAGGKTREPDFVQANPFGVRNMIGNVWEYCSDWYAEDAYASGGQSVSNPTGPAEGTEHVIRGGNYGSDAGDLRSAARAATQNEAWLKTDCQQPKSIWWYSDIKGIGFRVVCEKDPALE